MTYTLKLRHTGSDTKGGGIGPMVTDNLSCTLAAAVQDQTLITGGGREMSDSKPRRELTYATVCSGIECMSVACIGLPMRPVFFSEIEPFPCAVLKAHYPDVPNLGDMSKIQVSNDGKEITNGTTSIRLHERLGILAGGTPCQDVSVAGKRAGMQEGSGTRSSLAFDFVRLARELRPRWVLWENVAGSIDSKNAPDFLRFASALGDCGYSLAWRVLDAQYVRVDGMERAVPQRRRRVWVVGCAGADESVPAEILFEPDSVAGHTAPRRRAGQGFAYSLAGRDRVDAGLVGEPAGNGARECGGELPVLDMMGGKTGAHFTTDNSSPTFTRGRASVNDIHAIALDGDKLKPRTDQRKGGNGFGINEDGAGYTLTGVDRHGVAYKSSNGKGEEVSATLSADDITQSGQGYVNNSVIQIASGVSFDGRKDAPIADGVAHSQTIGTNPGFKDGVVVSTAYKLDSTASNSMKSANPNSGFHETQVAACLDTTTPDPSKAQGGNVIISTNSNGEDVAATINANMSKLGGDNQTTFGGGYCITRREEGAHDEPQL